MKVYLMWVDKGDNSYQLDSVFATKTKAKSTKDDLLKTISNLICDYDGNYTEDLYAGELKAYKYEAQHGVLEIKKIMIAEETVIK